MSMSNVTNNDSGGGSGGEGDINLAELAAEESEYEHWLLAVHGFGFCCVVVLCLLAGLLLRKKKFYYLPESGAAMLLGMHGAPPLHSSALLTLALLWAGMSAAEGFIVGGFISLFGESEARSVVFNPFVFFFILLPPIIFEAGFTLDQKSFFKNLGSILTYAVFGTIISCLVFGYMMFGAARGGFIHLNADTPLEAMLFGSLVSATDPVATLALLGSPDIAADPLLYALVFGEAVLNDAVAIVLYQTFAIFLHQPFSGLTMLGAVFLFFGIAIGSTLVGGIMGLLCSLLFKKVDLKEFLVYEFTLVRRRLPIRLSVCSNLVLCVITANVVCVRIIFRR